MTIGSGIGVKEVNPMETARAGMPRTKEVAVKFLDGIQNEINNLKI